ncbi:MAG TPA: hypothetical protein VFJ68_06315 [Casimicrobiaceae bacterium]|nr:hypothetical protein [Casimicrobiaceae bacterium]
MSNHPVKRSVRPVRTVEGDLVDLPAPVERMSAGFSFRYSYAEFSAVGKSAKFKTKRARYENGKLSAESFEGELDPKTYENMVNDVQRYFADQAAFCLQAFRSFLLPFTKD